jgi:predicted phage terminase large subunit-like protein
MTRLEPGATVIIIATRWHSDDLIGRILKNFPGKWENIFLPAEAMENDLIGRPVGAPLFPTRYPLTELHAQKELLGSIFYGALYQQQPTDETAKFTDKTWLKTTPALTANDFKWARIWDLAATQGGGDYTTGSLCGYSKSKQDFITANIIRRQLNPGRVENLVRNTAVADGTDVTIGIEQEPGSAGKALVEHYANTVLREFKVVAIPATKAKAIRAQPYLAACEAGHVYLLDETVHKPEGSEPGWQDHYIREFEGFPTGQFDDQVDTNAAGYTFLSGKKTLSTSWGRSKPKDHKANSKQLRKASFMLGTTNKVRRATFGRH